MDDSAARFIFLFLDGVGLGEAQATNPLAAIAAMPFLTQLLDGPLLSDRNIQQTRLLFQPIDAILGVPGLPQSATGQTSLFTGCNAPAFMGRHLSAFANGSLRTLIESHGMFKQVLNWGGSVTHANLYSPAYFEAIAKRRRRYSVGTLLALTAGVPFRMGGGSDRQMAISWDITGEYVNQRGGNVPPLTPTTAGERLATIGSQHHLTLFECYLPDYAGHSQDKAQITQVLRLVDAFVESVVAHLQPHVNLVISSDHGNIEDLSHPHHTANPVPLIVIGPQAIAFQPVQDITGITPKIMELLQIGSNAAPSLHHVL
uniref:alkaline phosphatase family protein n=1 Tax=Trichocoleus desertorum TaxID=1481672 RepID=UPI0025B4DCF8|nr:alkaline phosphatase family protein [Trichocoleus desertorum]